MFISSLDVKTSKKSAYNFMPFLQLVQFLLKQAGADRRTGDLYGNQDLLNIARNMARGLKVCQKHFLNFVGFGNM